MSRTVCLVTARMASARCPGKALQELLPGEPLLGVLLKRMRTSKAVDEVALATSVNPENDAIADLGRSLGVRVFRGDEDDVLKRHVDAVREFAADHVVRVTGDNPLTDVNTLDALWTRLWSGGPAEREVRLEIERDGARQSVGVHSIDRAQAIKRASGV